MKEDPRNAAKRKRQFARLSLRQKILHAGRSRKRVLFGQRGEWVDYLRRHIDHLRYEFCDGAVRHADLSRFDAIVPFHLEEYDVLRALGDRARNKVILPDPRVVALCDDKAKFNNAILGSPFSDLIPTIYAASDLRFPLIVKKKRDEFGENSFILRERDSSIAEYLNDDYFFQDIVPGDKEYTTHVLMKSGTPYFMSGIRYEMGQDVYVKSVTRSPRAHFLDQDNRFWPKFVEMLKYIGYNDGTCCINYKISNGSPKVFEINPRYGASLGWDITRYLDAYFTALRA